MKNILFILLALSLGFTANAQTKKDRDNYEIQVDGLGCPFCAYGLEKKFKEFKGIKNVKIEMETGVFTFTYPATEPLTLEQVTNQVDVAGYTAVTTQIERWDGTKETAEAEKTELTDESEVIETSIFVAGNCGMCKARIEKAATSLMGVVDAEWDSETKMLALTYDKNQIEESAVAEAIATSGHDTKTTTANADTYEALPGCCQYDRVEN